MIPVYAFLEGDTMGLVVLLAASDTMREVAAKVQAAADVRVPPRDSLVVVHRDLALDPTATVGDAEIALLDRIDVRRGERS